MAQSLNKMQLGRYGEYFVKMEFTRLGLDVYVPEVDDKGIDCVIRTRAGSYFEIQVKALRGPGLITLPVKTFKQCESRLVAIALFSETLEERSPQLLLIPSTAFPKEPLPGHRDQTPEHGKPLKYYKRPHQEKAKDFNECQVHVSKRNTEGLLKQYAFEEAALRLR